METKTLLFSDAAALTREIWPWCRAPIVGTRPTESPLRSSLRRWLRSGATSRKMWIERVVRGVKDRRDKVVAAPRVRAVLMALLPQENRPAIVFVMNAWANVTAVLSDREGQELVAVLHHEPACPNRAAEGQDSRMGESVHIISTPKTSSQRRCRCPSFNACSSPKFTSTSIKYKVGASWR